MVEKDSLEPEIKDKHKKLLLAFYKLYKQKEQHYLQIGQIKSKKSLKPRATFNEYEFITLPSVDNKETNTY